MGVCNGRAGYCIFLNTINRSLEINLNLLTEEKHSASLLQKNSRSEENGL
jgi:hypothetical protein